MNLHHIKLSHVATNNQQKLIDDPLILKVAEKNDFVHGIVIPDLKLNTFNMFDTSLHYQNTQSPMANPYGIIVRDDHPDFAWIMLQVAETQLVDKLSQ